VLISFTINISRHQHFTEKKQYSVIVKFLFVCRFVFYVNVNNLLPEICTCIYYVHRLCVLCSVLFIFFFIIYFVLWLKICQLLARKRAFLWNVYIY